MQFIFEKVEKSAEVLKSLREVEYDQFFIDKDGWLCQKVKEYEYNTIADCDGMPCSIACLTNEENIVKTVLPTVIKVEF